MTRDEYYFATVSIFQLNIKPDNGTAYNNLFKVANDTKQSLSYKQKQNFKQKHQNMNFNFVGWDCRFIEDWIKAKNNCNDLQSTLDFFKTC